ncbi:MAG: 5-formyltetrahydrofolate cyclo-ligase [Lachnospiraceae bacterium]|nr:5-formyltetrahydrofolate cyclo-ligase [Lachnospiraceae bacterium]
MKKLREALSSDERLYLAQKIMETAASHSDFEKAENLLVYMYTGSEVRTDGIINCGFQRGKRVFVPRVSGREMEFYEIRDLKECIPGFMGILEPPEDAQPFVFGKKMKREDTLMILPGLAFDEKGKRLGYGGGFYDRYLAKHPDCIKMGIAYDFQCREEVPTEETDICADIIITEKRVIIPSEAV